MNKKLIGLWILKIVTEHRVEFELEIHNKNKGIQRYIQLTKKLGFLNDASAQLFSRK